MVAEYLTGRQWMDKTMPLMAMVVNGNGGGLQTISCGVLGLLAELQPQR